MIRESKPGSIYICMKKSKDNMYFEFDGEIQIDVDCLGRDRFVGYSKKSFNPIIDSHRINLSKNPGEIFEQENYYSFWLPLDNKKSVFANVTILNDGVGYCECSRCHQTIDPGDNFCKSCGSKIIARKLIGKIYGSEGKIIK